MTRFLIDNDSHDSEAVGLVDRRDFTWLPTEETVTMSLPGLQISTPVEVEATPIIHELKEGTEWRFEVAFGLKVEVKVRYCIAFPV